MKQIPFIILTVLLSCNSNQEARKQTANADTTEILKSKTSSDESQNADTAKTEIIETFVDSLNIGEKGRCKVELTKLRVYDDNFVIIKFYIKGSNTTKGPETWMKTNTYCYETTAMSGFEPNISDFDNDNFNDITFISGNAARGANEVRRLLIYNSQDQELRSLVNSQDYPNMLYNKDLDCIDAFLVYGGCSTVFLRIEGDSLIKFASVELDDGLTVSTFDRNGKAKAILTDKTNEAGYIRYKSFKPLKEYENY